MVDKIGGIEESEIHEKAVELYLDLCVITVVNLYKKEMQIDPPCKIPLAVLLENIKSRIRQSTPYSVKNRIMPPISIFLALPEEMRKKVVEKDELISSHGGYETVKYLHDNFDDVANEAHPDKIASRIENLSSEDLIKYGLV